MDPDFPGPVSATRLKISTIAVCSRFNKFIVCIESVDRILVYVAQPKGHLSAQVVDRDDELGLGQSRWGHCIVSLLSLALFATL